MGCNAMYVEDVEDRQNLLYTQILRLQLKSPVSQLSKPFSDWNPLNIKEVMSKTCLYIFWSLWSIIHIYHHLWHLRHQSNYIAFDSFLRYFSSSTSPTCIDLWSLWSIIHIYHHLRHLRHESNYIAFDPLLRYFTSLTSLTCIEIFHTFELHCVS